MNWGVETIARRLRNGTATFTRQRFAPNRARSQCSWAFLARNSKTPRHIWAAGDAKQQTSDPARRGCQRRKLVSAFCQSCHESGHRVCRQCATFDRLRDLCVAEIRSLNPQILRGGSILRLGQFAPTSLAVKRASDYSVGVSINQRRTGPPGSFPIEPQVTEQRTLFILDCTP
jgi:hypothetical protein